MNVLSPLFQKVVSIGMSLLCSASILTSTGYTKPIIPVHNIVVSADKLTNDYSYSIPKKEAETKTTNTSVEDTADQENETEAQQNEQTATAEADSNVLETIDISATPEDDVTLTIYASPKKAAAADKATVGFVERETRLQDENGEPDMHVTAVISGNGDMEDNVYRHFVDVDQYINITRVLLAQEYGINKEDISYNLPEGVTDLIEVDAQIEYYANENCAAIPAGTVLEITDAVRDAIDPAAMLKYSPDAIGFDGDITSISDAAFLFCSELTEIEIPATVKTIGENAFSFCDNLTEVVLNEGLESIGDRAFMYCDSLEEIVLPTTINHIGEEAFIFMKDNSRIVCPTQEVYDLVTAEDTYAFIEGRTVVEFRPATISIGNENETQGTATINGNGQMEEKVYGNFIDVEKYIDTVRSLLAEEYGLDKEDVEYTLPEDVNRNDLIEVDSAIEYYATKESKAGPAGTVLEITDNVRDAIDPTTMLKYSPDHIDFSGNVTSISNGAFLFCKDLKEVALPATVKTIGNNAFSFCTGLTKITLNEGLESIGDRAFMYCESLEEIVLPTTLTHIGEEAFIYLKENSRIVCPTQEVYDLVMAEGMYTFTEDVTVVCLEAK